MTVLGYSTQRYKLAGFVSPAARYRGRWNVYRGARLRGHAPRVGYVEPSTRVAGRWNVYVSGHFRAGYVERSNGSRWNVHGWAGVWNGYLRAGWAQGPSGVIGGAAFLLLIK